VRRSDAGAASGPNPAPADGEWLWRSARIPDAWLDTLAAACVPLSTAGASAALAGTLLLGRRRRTGIMEAVWPLTMLYSGLAAHAWLKRAGAPQDGRHGACADRPMRQATVIGTMHWEHP